MVVGLKHAKKNPQDLESKQAAHDLVNEVARRFRAKYGSIDCSDLLGCDLGTPQGAQEARDKNLFRQLCPTFVRDAAEILEEVLNEGT